MSNMNFFSTGLAGLLPGLNGSGLGAPVPTVPASPGGQDNGGFADLLGLVGDMETADAQLGASEEFLSKEIPLLEQPEVARLQAARNESALAWALPMGAPAPVASSLTNPLTASDPNSIGRTPFAGGEMQEAQLSLTAIELEGLSQAGLNRLASAPTPLRGEAVAQWSAALAADDIKSVVVEKDRLPTSIEAEGPIRGFVHDQAPVLDVQTSGIPFEAGTRAESSNRSSRVEARAEGSAKPDTELATLRSNAFFVRASEKAESVRPRAETSLERAASEPRSAVDLLLDRSDLAAQSGLRADLVAHAKTPAVVGASLLADAQGDSRISSDSVSFVAQRIDQLKAQGGGTLKVELTPDSMGVIEIRVSMSRNQVRVQLAAERPETLRALEGARGDLLSRLEGGSRAADLEFVAKASAFRTEVLRPSGTEYFLDAREAPGSRRAPDMQATVLESGSLTSARDERSFNGSDRGDRRDQARDRWESVFRDQRSA